MHPAQKLTKKQKTRAIRSQRYRNLLKSQEPYEEFRSEIMDTIERRKQRPMVGNRLRKFSQAPNPVTGVIVIPPVGTAEMPKTLPKEAINVINQPEQGVLTATKNVKVTPEPVPLPPPKVDATKIFKRIKWSKGAAIGALTITAFMMFGSAFPKKEPRMQRVNRGYGDMRKAYTDFGSPLNLAKTANKVITQYHSIIRKATKTTTAAVTRRNIALQYANNAIGHTRL
jgi:hypothetical protein